MERLNFYSILLLIGALTFCGAQVKDKESLAKVKEKAIEGDKPSMDAMVKSLEKDSPKEQPDLHLLVLKEMGDIKTDTSRETLEKHARSENEGEREVAIQSLDKHREETLDEELNETMINTIDENYNDYGKISPAEIKVLGKIPESSSLDLLNASLYDNPENRPIAIRSIGNIMSKAKSASETNERKEEDREKADNRVENSDKNDKDKETKENSDGHATDTSEKQPTKETNSTGKPAYNTSLEAELILRDLIVSDVPLETKELAINELYNSSYENGDQKMQDLLNSPEVGQPEKEIILKLVGGKSNELSKKLATKWKRDYKKTRVKEKKEKLVKNLMILKGEERKTILAELVKIKKRRPAYTISRKKARRLKKMPARKAVLSILKKYKIKSDDLDKMETSLISKMQKSKKSKRSITSIVFAGLQHLNPDKNYFELQELAKSGFNYKGMMYAVLNTVHHSYESDELRILAVKNLFHISNYKATALVKAYKKERGYLKYIAR